MTRSHRLGTLFAIGLIAMGTCLTFGAFAYGIPVAHAAHVAGHTDVAPSGAGTTGTKPENTTWIGEKINDLFSWIFAKIASVFAWLLGVAAITLDMAVYYTIVHMSDFIKGISGIGVAWRILRDIGNILLIFGFLASGIAVIVNASFFGFGSKMLPMLLVAAVFLNFSFFMSAAIVDVGNLFATEIFKQINNGEIVTPAKLQGGIFTSVSNEGISNRIMGVLGLQTIYQQGSTNTLAPADSKLKNSMLVSFMAIFLFIIATLVFFALAFIVIARFVALIFLIIVAPIGFAGLAIPKLGGLASKWWSMLFEQTIAAPVLMLLLYVALAVITSDGFLRFGGLGTNAGTEKAQTAWTNFLSPSGTGGVDLQTFAGIFLVFLIAMGLLLVVVIAAKQMSAFGAGWAIRMGGRATFGAVAWGGRLSFGTAGNMLTSKRAMAWAERGGKYGKYFRRIPVFAGRGLRNITYDARNMGAGSALGAFGVDAGTPSKLTPRQIEEFRKKYQPMIPGTKVEEGTYWKESSAEYAAAAREVQAKKDLKRAVDGVDDNLAQRTLGRMSTKELESLDGIKQGVDILVRNLSPEQFENLMKSEKLDESQKDSIRRTRFTPLDTAVTSRNRDAVQAYAVKDLERLGESKEFERLLTDTTFASLLSDDQFDALSKSSRLTSVQQNGLRTARNERFSRTNAPTTLSSMSPDAVAKLPNSVLTQPHVYENLTMEDFGALMGANKLSSVNREDFGKHISRALTLPAHPKHLSYTTYIAGGDPRSVDRLKQFYNVS